MTKFFEEAKKLAKSKKLAGVFGTEAKPKEEVVAPKKPVVAPSAFGKGNIKARKQGDTRLFPKS